MFLLLRSGVMCLRGHWSFKRHPVSANVDLAYSDGCLDGGALK